MIANSIQWHKLLSSLIIEWEASFGVLGTNRYVHLQKLWRHLPNEISIEDLGNLLCPIFAVNPFQQDQFKLIFSACKDTIEIEDKIEVDAPRVDAKKKPETPHIPSAPVIQPSPEKVEGQANRMPLVVEMQECNQPPLTWNVPIVVDTQKLNLVENLRQTAVQLRLRETGDFKQIDVPASIQVSVQNLGLLTLQYAHTTRLPQYLCLIERFSRNDHRSKLFDDYFQVLLKNEVSIIRFFYEGNINIVRNEKHPAGLSLHDLQRKYPQARLLIFGLGHNLIDAKQQGLKTWADALKKWSFKVMFSYVPLKKWGWREELLKKTMLVLPTSTQGLNLLPSLLPQGLAKNLHPILSDYSPFDLTQPIMPELSKHFDSKMLCWIASCAIYPALYYNLTLQIGAWLKEAFEDNLLNLENLLALFRLPWFIDGNIPVEAREELLNYFEERHPEVYSFILQALWSYMEKNIPIEPSIARIEHQINLSILKARAGAKLNKNEFEELAEIVKYLNREKRRGDFILPLSLANELIQSGKIPKPEGNDKTNINSKTTISIIDSNIKDLIIKLKKGNAVQFLIDVKRIQQEDNRLKNNDFNVLVNKLIDLEYKKPRIRRHEYLIEFNRSGQLIVDFLYNFAKKLNTLNYNNMNAVNRILLYLSDRNIQVKSFSLISPENDPIDRIALHIGKKFNDIRRMYDLIRRNMGTGAPIHLDLKNQSQEVVSNICQLCFNLHQIGFLATYRYLRAPEYIIQATPSRLPAALNFFSGEWLKRYICCTIKNIFESTDLSIESSFMTDIQIIRQDGSNSELDVMFSIGDSILWFERKTGAYQNHMAKYNDFSKEINLPLKNKFIILTEASESLSQTLTNNFKMTVLNVEQFTRSIKEHMTPFIERHKNIE